MRVEQTGDRRTAVWPIDLDGRRVLMTVSHVEPHGGGDDEEEVASRRSHALDHVLDGVSAFADQLAKRFETTTAARMTVAFGCDVAVESGGFVALIGKASTSSTFTVELEWAK